MMNSAKNRGRDGKSTWPDAESGPSHDIWCWQGCQPTSRGRNPSMMDHIISNHLIYFDENVNPRYVKQGSYI